MAKEVKMSTVKKAGKGKPFAKERARKTEMRNKKGKCA
jgi:hypothetical protein